MAYFSDDGPGGITSLELNTLSGDTVKIGAGDHPLSLGGMVDMHGEGSDAPNPSRGTEISPRILGADEAPCDKHGGCPHRSDCVTYKLACQSFFQWAVGHELTKRDRATYPLQVPCRHSYRRVFNDHPDTLPPVPHHYQEQEPITRKAMLRAIAESK